MKKNYLNKRFVQFLLDRHNPEKQQVQNDIEKDEAIEPDAVISHLLEEYKKVKSEYENLLKR